MYSRYGHSTTPAYVPPPTATINSSFVFSTNNDTHVTIIPSNDKYTYSGDVTNARELAIIGTVKMLGFMSLKNGDHNVSGHNSVTTRRILKEAVETRKAADVLLASGAVVLLGTWSNGIAVGPGAGFVPVSHTNVTPITATKKSRNAHTNPRGTAAETIAYNAERLAAAEEKMTGDYCDMRYTDGASCSIGPVVTPAVAPPGVMLSSFHATCNNGTLAAQWRVILHRAARKTGEAKRVESQPFNFVLYHDGRIMISSSGRIVTEPSEKLLIEARIALGIERPAQPVTDAPTPIRATPAYTAAAGDTVALTYSHENGTTTDRVVTIHRMTATGFRGYDHTYRKARNYHFDHITRLALHTGEEDLAAG